MTNEQPQNPLPSLMSRFPYQFAGENIGISVAKGWSELFTKLCEDIDVELGEDKRGFYWRQVKEKFGTGRFYWKLGRNTSSMRIDIVNVEGHFSLMNSPATPMQNRDFEISVLMAKLEAIVESAERQTKSTCIVCGANPAAIDSTGGWVLNLCEEHSKQRRADERSLPSPYFQ